MEMEHPPIYNQYTVVGWFSPFNATQQNAHLKRSHIAAYSGAFHGSDHHGSPWAAPGSCAQEARTRPIGHRSPSLIQQGTCLPQDCLKMGSEWKSMEMMVLTCFDMFCPSKLF